MSSDLVTTLAAVCLNAGMPAKYEIDIPRPTPAKAEVGPSKDRMPDESLRRE